MSSRGDRESAPLDYVRRTAGALVQRGAKGQVGKALWGWLRLSREAGGQETNSETESKRCRGCKAVHLPDASPKGIKHTTGTWSENVIFAGGSAFLLLLAILIPNYWYFSFFALTPLLYRTLKATPGECLRLGFIFGLVFFGGSVVHSLFASLFPSVLKFFSGTAIFALFGWSVGCARQRWGFNPFILVFLWVGLELAPARVGFVGSYVHRSVQWIALHG
jgi:hypothetical protein